MAAQQGHHEVLAVLLDRGANVDVQDKVRWQRYIVKAREYLEGGGSPQMVLSHWC